jgi:NADH:ubiquinone oxidoreductase subunit 5 (subunit L)/multisubunit Na+/H+ antiporter MnhA subunit
LILVLFSTAIISSINAASVFDVKNMLANSTILQTSIIIMIYLISSLGESLCYFTSHAFYKAGFFIAIGYIILLSNENQDIRNLSYILIKFNINVYLIIRVKFLILVKSNMKSI